MTEIREVSQKQQHQPRDVTREEEEVGRKKERMLADENKQQLLMSVQVPNILGLFQKCLTNFEQQ